jgi:hypothetical protein
MNRIDRIFLNHVNPVTAICGPAQKTGLETLVRREKFSGKSRIWREACTLAPGRSRDTGQTIFKG